MGLLITVSECFCNPLSQKLQDTTRLLKLRQRTPLPLEERDHHRVKGISRYKFLLCVIEWEFGGERAAILHNPLRVSSTHCFRISVEDHSAILADGRPIPLKQATANNF